MAHWKSSLSDTIYGHIFTYTVHRRNIHQYYHVNIVLSVRLIPTHTLCTVTFIVHNVYSPISFFLTERIVYFLNTVHCYNLLEEYCYYEIQIHKALCEFAVEKGIVG